MSAFDDQCHTDFVISDRGNVSLPSLSPVDLDSVAPRDEAEVTPQSDAPFVFVSGSQTGPAADLRVLAVGADDPAAGDKLSIQNHGAVLDPGDTRSPAHHDTGVVCGLHHAIM